MSMNKMRMMRTAFRRRPYTTTTTQRCFSTFPVINPSTGTEFASAPDMGAPETHEAIQRASEAQAWGRQSLAKERAAILRRMYDITMERQNELGEVLARESGKPITEAKGEIAYGASFLEWFAEEAKRNYGDIIPHGAHGRRLLTIQQPVGVCGLITPWNFPNAMITRKLAPALAAGCASVVKAPAETPMSALELAKIAQEAGVPEGVFNVITCSHENTAAVGDALCENRSVRKLSFTGSTRVGMHLLRQCAATVKKTSMELGGNAPFIVFEDADIEEAVKGCIASKFRNTGQTCVCANRIFVHSSLYEKFQERLYEEVSKLVVGNALDPTTQLGPLIHQNALEKVSRIVDESVSQGARVVLGGQKDTSNGGYFYKPTILANVAPTMPCCEEEIFGPVAPLVKFSSTEEVIEMANNVEVGLAGYFYTQDLSKAWHVAEALEVGMVGVNEGIISAAAAPFGGVKYSGMGREGGHEGLQEYLETKYICMGGLQG
eukprot:gb/GECG01005063.1/.p1 GENE.gb/GECG01005063.1/~~gb/GECG01005063.1/.p1  ORF type:complete len:492 (+),score=58.87 gb/GECG01005063.1/:1-1476(+)